MWYIQLQQAMRIIEEREREANERRLARMARDGWNPPPPGPGFGSRVRGGSAAVAAALNRGAGWVARALQPGHRA
jgi:hypothetical protein